MQTGCEGNVMLSVNDVLLNDLVREADGRAIPLQRLVTEIVECYVADQRLAKFPPPPSADWKNFRQNVGSDD